MRMLNFRQAMQVCVRQCPTSDITTPQEAKEFAIHNKSRLCSYDIGINEYTEEKFTEVGPCPDLPVLKR